MKFSFGEVLSRAWQITWKHKNLWLAGILVGLISFIPTLVSFLFNPSFASFADPSDVNRALPSILLVNALVILLSIALIPVFVMGMAVPSLGTIRVEEGSEKLNFGELIKGVLPYFWRILGIFLVVWVGAVLVVMAFLACIFIFSMLTMGIGALCAVPLFILFIPFAVLVYALTEQGVSAVLVDNLRFSDALQRAWELLRKNLGVLALMSIIVYLGSIVVSMIISVPMMIPMFEFILNMGTEPDMQSVERLSRNMILWTLAFSPIYAVFQGIILTFMQSAWTLTYLRLTRNPKLQPLPVTAEAAM